MFNNMRLTKKLPALVLGAAIILGTGIGVGSYVTASATLSDITNQRLQSASQTGKTIIEDYFKNIDAELTLLSRNLMTADALKEFGGTWNAWKMLGGNPTESLKKAYIDENPHPIGEKQLLDKAETGSHYDVVHAKFHPIFREIQESGGYYDLFLFDAKGNLVYSVFKEADFATNFAEGGGEWADTDLGIVFQKAIIASEKDRSVFTDFKGYGPSNGAAASFIARPVFDPAGKLMGALAFQMPVDRINATLSHDTGLGETGEFILVGEDGLMRNDSATSKDTNDILQTRPDLPFLSEAFANGTASGVANANHTEPMAVVATAFDHLGDGKYAFVAMQSVAEAQAPVKSLGLSMAFIGLVLLVVVGIVGWLAARGVTRPIGLLVADMNKMAAGNTDVALEGAERSDEIGDMTKAVVVFRDSMSERQRLESASQEAEQERMGRQNRIDGLIESFKGEVENALQEVADNTEAMNATSDILTQLADATSDEANSAASTTEEASVNVQTVAASAEQLAASISEISRQVETTSQTVGQATVSAQSTNEKVASLAEAATNIGAVVALIQDIAEQTNLLALNATIEAARAGDAGKGFAVVASEVKQLAEQTAKATEEISTQINTLQGSTTEAVAAIDAIANTMDEVNTYTQTISSAVEQQGAATSEINVNVNQAAQGTQGIVANIAAVSSSIGETGQSAAQVRLAANAVNERTEHLSGTIERFLRDVAAA
ncbi:MAG: methyl-accepting chemotaxis protein [Stappiaceae bacterium]